jgi:HAD superfamily hydrolase (TIGR01490 family)
MNPDPVPSRIAAFFDLDGTLIPFPTLERRLVSALLYRHAIPISNVAWWPLAFARLAARGLAHARQANKMHFRGISAELTARLAGQLTGRPRLPFFPQALDCVAWHASQGHRIALVTGTPQFLARCVAFSLEEQLAQRGLAITVLVRATILEGAAGRWTGRVSGEPMFGGAKATAVDSLASRLHLDPRHCYGYGDSLHDCPMLERLGHPIAANPSQSLRRCAIRRGWQVADWEVQGRQAGRKFPFLKTKVETLG